MSKTIRFLNQEDVSQYEPLLRRSFGSAQGFTVNAGTCLWTQTDDYYPTLGAFDGDILKSTLRLEWILSPQELKYKANEPIDFKDIAFPMGYVAKVATEPEDKNKGYNALLRYYALEISRYWRVKWLIGFMVEGSPRVQSMKDMGYQFFYKKKKWSGSFLSDRNVVVGILPEAKFISAQEVIQKKVPDLLSQYQCLINCAQVPMSSELKLRFPWSA